jgi:hypothetical protein
MIRQLERDSENRIVKANLPKGHCNGVAVSIKLKDGIDFSSLEGLLSGSVVRSEFVHKQVEYLSTNIPLSIFVALSDINFGSIGQVSRALTLDQFTTGGGALTVSEAANAQETPDSFAFTENAYTFYMDFGSIYCENGNELEVELEFDSDSHALAVDSVSVYSISHQLLPFHFRQYDIDFDLNEDHNNVIQSWLFTETLDKDAQVVVQADSVQYDSDMEGFRANTQIFGKIENLGVGILTKLFESRFGVPEDAWVKITRNTGTALQSDTSRMGILNIRLKYPISLSTNQNLENLQEQLRVVTKFEKDNPEQAVAMVASGHMSSSIQVKDAIRMLTGAYEKSKPVAFYTEKNGGTLFATK